MQVYPEPSGSRAAAFASSTAGYALGKPEAAPFASQPPLPPSYPPPAYQPPVNAYGFNPSFAPAPPTGRAIAPASYGYPIGPVAPLNQLQNNQNVQVNVIHATSSPIVVTQPAPVIMPLPSYLGWSIFNFLCCFWPLGLAAIIYSVKVGSARTREEAKSYSLTARNLNIAATAMTPILVIVVAGAVVGAGGVAGSAASNSRYSSSYYSNAYYNSYSYYYYYTYLTYYSYYGYYRYWAYGYDTNGNLFSQYDEALGIVTASKYAVGVYYSG